MKQSALLLETVAQATHILAESPFDKIWHYEVLTVQPGAVTLFLPLRPEFFRPGGRVQGGCLMSMADVAFWLASMTLIGIDAPCVTLEMKTNFLHGATSDLSCRAEVMSSGQRILYGTATTTESSGKVLAHHTLTYYRK